MKLKLSDWANIAEVLGGIAIVVSLVFVGLEIRRNTDVTRAATFQQHMSNEIDLLALFGASPETTRVYVTATENNLEGLDEWEARQGLYLAMATYRLWEDFYLQRLSGTLSEEGWAAREPLLRRWAGRDIAMRLVERGTVVGEFADYIREIHSSDVE